MFEALVLACLADRPDICREVLLPGAEAPSMTACLAHVPDRPEFPGVMLGDATCREVSPGLEFQEIAPGLLVHEGQVAEPDRENLGDVSNLAIVIGARSVAVIDSGGAAWMGEATWRAIRARTDLPVSHVILTHMHPDHVFGASVLARGGAEVVGHTGLDRALADRQAGYLYSFADLIGAEALIGTVSPQVTIPVADSLQIDLGNRVLTLTSWPSAHTGTDLTVIDEATGTLIAGDLLFHRHAPALDGSLRGWQLVLSDLTDLPFAAVVPGHGDAVLPWPGGAAPLLRYLDRLAQDTRAALDRGERLGDAVKHIAESEGPAWQLFDAYNARNATVAFTELEWE